MKSAVFFAALIAGAAACGCGSASNPSDQTKAASSDSSKGGNYVASDAKGIQTITVKTSSVPDYLELAAHVEADPTRSRLVQHARHGEHQLGMGVVRNSQRLALQPQAGAAGQVELDGDGFTADQLVDSADLVKSCGELGAEGGVIAAAHDGNGAGGCGSSGTRNFG